MSGMFVERAARGAGLVRAARVGFVGSGFRARTMLRVVTALPEWFAPAGVAARNAADRELLGTLGLPAYPTLDALLREGAPDFVVLTLHAGDAQPVLRDLADAGVPALTETPAAGSVPELVALHDLVQRGACLHVAEQYHLEPLVAAQLAVAASGRLGQVTDVQVSLAHDYHGLSVLRRALGVTFEDALVTARRDARQVIPSPSRYADPADLTPVSTVRTQAWLDFGDRLGGYDFDDVQYRSWVRSPSLLVRGPLGELRDEVVRSVSGGQPLVSRLDRMAAGGAGSHEGMFLRGYLLDGAWVHSNPFRPARLADEELSIAESFARMAAHVLAGGPSPYDLAEAAQDQYLNLMVRAAAERRESLRTARQPWADATGCRR